MYIYIYTYIYIYIVYIVFVRIHIFIYQGSNWWGRWGVPLQLPENLTKFPFSPRLTPLPPPPTPPPPLTASSSMCTNGSPRHCLTQGLLHFMLSPLIPVITCCYFCIPTLHISPSPPKFLSGWGKWMFWKSSLLDGISRRKLEIGYTYGKKYISMGQCRNLV